ncbi:MAG: hypothetical protein ACR2FE_00475 [Aeromicrobium sp.]
MTKKLKMPTGLGAAGERLWKSVTDEYELEEHETSLLVQTVRTVDALEKLDALVRRDGPVVSGPQGERANPALVEARQQRIALARLLAVLRLPSGDEGDQKAGARPQRRAGARGTYGIRGMVG